ncbi:MAG: YihY family inner membrane protein [Deltaproteobacteria bacterium]|nr:YihY family inner membrane protein [Deltaproteobacteria bacterium]
MRERLRRLRRAVFHSDLGSHRGLRYRAVYLARLMSHIFRQWGRDRCPSQASALSFETAFSMVPCLAVAFALLKATGALEARSALVEFLSKNMLPAYGDSIGKFLIQFSDNINAGVLGTIGTIGAFIISYFVFHELEHIFNDIWRVTQRRSLLNKAVIFYTLITLAPSLTGLSMYHTARYWSLNRGVVGWLAPIGLVWVALVLANRLLPRAKVKWSSAAIGALISAVLFEVLKRGVAVYLVDLMFRRYTGIYGALALLPLLLLWIYVTWLVVLLGAEVAYAVQNFHYLDTLDRRAHGNGPEDHINGVVGTRVMVEVARAFRDGEKVSTRIELASRFEVSQEVMTVIVDRLKRADLLMEVEGDVTGIALARAPSEITVEQVMAPFRPVDVRNGSEEAGRLNLLLREMEQARRSRSEKTTLQELLGPPAPSPAGEGAAPAAPAAAPASDQRPSG